jgi:CubicO group peptidase (beta-lactamase class C family)
MSGLKAEVDPAEVGLDAQRLERLDRHFAWYVDDGRLPGWLVAVSRRGCLAHVSCYGSRDLEAGLPVEPDTLWRIYSMTKPVTSVAEVASGQRLDEFFAARILGPLGMTDTAFYAGDEGIGRLAALYTPTGDGKTARLDSLGRVAASQPG